MLAQRLVLKVRPPGYLEIRTHHITKNGGHESPARFYEKGFVVYAMAPFTTMVGKLSLWQSMHPVLGLMVRRAFPEAAMPRPQACRIKRMIQPRP